MFKLGTVKTEVLIIGPKNHTINYLEHCLTLDGCSLDSSSSVRNLGVLFDSNLSFDSHVSSICKAAFFSLKNISKLRPMLSMSNAEMFIHAFMTSRLDYYNALLGACSARLTNKLQMIQNAAARILIYYNIIYYKYYTPNNITILNNKSYLELISAILSESNRC